MYLPLSALSRFFRPAPAESASSVGTPNISNTKNNSSTAADAAEFADSAELAYHHTRVAVPSSSSSAAAASELSDAGIIGDQYQYQYQQSQLLPMPHRVPNSQRLPVDPLAERCANLLLVLLHNRR